MSLYILQYNTWQNYKLRLGRAPMFFMVVVDSHPFAISFIYHLTWICSVRVCLPHNILLEWIRSCWIIFSGAMMIMHWSWIDAWQRRFLCLLGSKITANSAFQHHLKHIPYCHNLFPVAPITATPSPSTLDKQTKQFFKWFMFRNELMELILNIQDCVIRHT